MDIVFDIDGTLADASHRLPYITNPDEPKNWDAFFDGAANDAPIPETWTILTGLLYQHNRLIFITGRPERLRESTYGWLREINCKHRCLAEHYWNTRPNRGPVLYMRSDSDRRPSSEVKRSLLKKARMDNFDPKIAFEDRASDAQMWREEGLLCCHVDEGQF